MMTKIPRGAMHPIFFLMLCSSAFGLFDSSTMIIQDVYNLSDLDNVNAYSPANGQVIAWNTSASQWENMGVSNLTAPESDTLDTVTSRGNKTDNIITSTAGFNAISEELIDDPGFDDMNSWKWTSYWSVSSSQAVHSSSPPSSIEEDSGFIPIVDAYYSITINITSNSAGGCSITMCGNTLGYSPPTTGFVTNSIQCSNTNKLKINSLGGPLTVEDISVKRLGNSEFGGADFYNDANFYADVLMSELSLNKLSVIAEDNHADGGYVLYVNGSQGNSVKDITIAASQGNDWISGSSAVNSGDISIIVQNAGQGSSASSGDYIRRIGRPGVGDSSTGAYGPGGSPGDYYSYGSDGVSPYGFGPGTRGTDHYFYAGDSGNSTDFSTNTFDGVRGGSMFFFLGKAGEPGDDGDPGPNGSVVISGGGLVVGNTTRGVYPVEFYGNYNGTTLWTEGNISTTGINERTSVWNINKGKALDHIYSAEEIRKPNGELDHLQMDGGECHIEPDYHNPIITKLWCDTKNYKPGTDPKCSDTPVKGWTLIKGVQYPKKEVCTMSRSKQINKHEEALYEARERIISLEKQIEKLESKLSRSNPEYAVKTILEGINNVWTII